MHAAVAGGGGTWLNIYKQTNNNTRHYGISVPPAPVPSCRDDGDGIIDYDGRREVTKSVTGNPESGEAR
jgi:hypothetical protein